MKGRCSIDVCVNVNVVREQKVDDMRPVADCRAAKNVDQPLVVVTQSREVILNAVNQPDSRGHPC
jgi:hypothetical protein